MAYGRSRRKPKVDPFARLFMWLLSLLWAGIITIIRELIGLNSQPVAPRDPGVNAGPLRRMWYDWRTQTFGARRQKWYRTVYLRSAHWHKVRKIVLKRDHNTCQVQGCGAQIELDVHHKSYTYLGRELERPEHLRTLITLCRYHHDQEHIQRRAEKGRKNIPGIRFPGQRVA